MGVSLLLGKQRSRRRRCQASGKASRACPLGFSRPPPPPQHTRSPRARPRLPFYPVYCPCFRCPSGLVRAPAHPSALCAHAQPFAVRTRTGPLGGREVGGSRGRTRSPCTAPVGLWAALRKRTPISRARKWASSRGACAEGAALRRRLKIGGGGWVVQMGDSNVESKVLRLGSEPPGRKVKPRSGQTGQGQGRAHTVQRGSLGNAFDPGSGGALPAL